MKQRELARRLGVTEARVSQMLRARNPTIRTLARLADAMDRRLVVRLVPHGTAVDPHHYLAA